MGNSSNSSDESFRKIFYGDLIFYVSSDVYEPDEDTFLLAENLRVRFGEEVLDVGTGCGILAVVSAFKASRVIAVDINPHAVRCAKKNAEKNGVSEKIDFICGDLFGPLTDGSIFDLIIFNAPYLPTDDGELKEWIDYAWAGGRSGREVTDRFIHAAPKHLKRNGRLLLLQSSLSNMEETVAMLEKMGFKTEIVDEKRFFFETITIIKAAINC